MINVIRFIPNTLTLSRLFVTIIFVYLLDIEYKYGHTKFINLIAIFMYICLSDFFDGKIARKTNSTSVFGAKLDVFADLSYIVFTYSILIIMNALPLWFLAFIISKFIEFVLTSKYIKGHINSSKHPFVFDNLGRIVSVMFFIIPGIICTYKCFTGNTTTIFINLLLYVTFIGGLISSFFRIRACFILNSTKLV